MEHAVIDLLMDEGAQEIGKLPFNAVNSLYNKGLIYFDIPIQNNTIIIGIFFFFNSLLTYLEFTRQERIYSLIVYFNYFSQTQRLCDEQNIWRLF